MTAQLKMSEASFFLELLDALEDRGSSLTSNSSVTNELSFLLSAFLNALYSALEQSKPLLGVQLIQEYKKSHSQIFSGKDGLRNMTIHERHVGIEHTAYIPPRGDSVNFYFRNKPKLTKESEDTKPKNPADLVFSPSYYVEVDGQFVEIGELCRKHFYSLRKFLVENRAIS